MTGPGSAARTWLALGPVVLVLGGLFLGGLGTALWRSVATDGLAPWGRVLTASEVWRGLGLSLWIAGLSTLLSATIGLAAAVLLRARFPGRGAAFYLFQINLTVPHLVGAIGILYLFAQSGLFARGAAGLGWIDRPGDFPALIYDPAAVGIILTYVWKEVPFVALILLAQMQAVGMEFERAARTLGATPWQAVRHVLIPMIAPAWLAASAIVFAFAFGAYEIPALLGQHYPQALPVLAWRRHAATDLAARPEAMAISILIALISALAIWAYMRGLSRAADRAGRGQ